MVELHTLQVAVIHDLLRLADGLDPDELEAAVAGALAALAERSGKGIYRRAAAMLFSPGRRPIDDDQRLALVAWHLENGRGPSRRRPGS